MKKTITLIMVAAVTVFFAAAMESCCIKKTDSGTKIKKHISRERPRAEQPEKKKECCEKIPTETTRLALSNCPFNAYVFEYEGKRYMTQTRGGIILIDNPVEEK